MTLKTIPLGHILIRNENKQVTILTTMLVRRIKSNFFYYRNLHCVDNVRGTVIRDRAKVLGESPLSNSVHLTNKNLLKTPKNQPEFSTWRSGAGIAARLHVSVITIISDQSWSQCHPSVAYKSLSTLPSVDKTIHFSVDTELKFSPILSYQLNPYQTASSTFCYTIYGTERYCSGALNTLAARLSEFLFFTIQEKGRFNTA